MSVVPSHHREVRLAAHPEGMIDPRHLAIVTVPAAIAGPDEVLVRNRWFRVSISTRLMAERGARAVEGIPFPALLPGDTLADGAIGEVLSAPAASGLAPGMLVGHPLGWRDHAVVPAAHCVALPAEGIAPAAWLGHGWTAYAALTRGVPIHRGDTVLVTSGAGAIGSMAGQIARRLGAARVIGTTSGADKAAWMVGSLGYDVALRRDAAPLADQLAAAAPDGVDVIVDMVGGAQLAAGVAAAREGARIVLLGALTAELHGARASIDAPVTLDSFQLILRQVTVRGYSADRDAAAVMPEWLAWQRGAGLTFACTMVDGLDAAPAALHDACAGRLRGVVIVAL